MDQQIGVAANRASEVRVGVVGQPKVTAVHGGVDGLLHRAQQHRMDLLRVGSVFGGLGNFLKLTRRGVVTDRHANTCGLQIVAQHVLFLGRWTFVNAKQANVFATGDKVGRANIGCQHSLFNQTVRHVTGTRNNLFNSSRFIAHDLRFSGLKIYGPAHTTLFKQRLVHVV